MGLAAPSATERPAVGDGALLLAARLRTGAWIVLLATAAFFVADAVQQNEGLPVLAAVKVVQIVLLWQMIRATERIGDAQRLRWTAAIALGVIYLSTVISSVARGEALSTVLVLLAVTMATATFVPWGGLPQLFTAVCAGLAMAGTVHLVPVVGIQHPPYLWIASGTVLLGSVWISREHERQRRERRRAEQQLAAESRVSAALARVGEEMIRTESTSGVLGQLCGLVAELLSCDETALTLYDPGDDAFSVQASFGHRPADLEVVRSLSLPARTMQPLIDRFAREGVVELDASVPRPRQLRTLRDRHGNPRSVFAPLRRGGEVIGLISAHYRDGAVPFTDAQKRILLGTAQLASLALQNVRLLDELREANRIKSDFVSTMSHELRTPVSVILGYTEILADSETPAERQEVLGRVRRSALELLEMVEDTLSLSRLEAGADPPALEAVNVPQLFAELAAEFATLTPPDEVRLRWEGSDDLVVASDRRKLRTILKNLVGNALKFTVRGEVVLGCSRDGDVVRFVVRDTGIGIAPQHVPIIFDMFRQVDSSDARSYRGAGLGLHIVQRLVRQLGGEITVTSEVGRGSTFTFTLPVAAADAGGAVATVGTARESSAA
jgi:signal transduction histidine kinase